MQWVTDSLVGTPLELNSLGGVIQTVNVGIFPYNPVFDGANIWTPSLSGNSIRVVRASTGNQLNGPTTASFDGERVLVTNESGNTVTTFKAADLSLIANVPIESSTSPETSCSDGISFWVILEGTNNLLRF